MLNYYLYDTFCAQSDAKIPVWDLSVTRGLCAFDYLRTYNKLPFHLDDHIARLFNSARNLGLSLPKTADEISSIIHTLIANTTLDGEVGIKLLITGGTPEDYLLPTESKFIAWTQAPPHFPAQYYENGISLTVTPAVRPCPTIKHAFYADAIKHIMEGRKNGFNDIIHALPDGTLTETSIANLFFVKDGILITAPEHLILPGITRKVVLQLAQGIPLEERALHQTELAHVSECFITSSNREIMPISRIDALTLPVGPITRSLMEKFKTYTLENNHTGTLN